MIFETQDQKRVRLALGELDNIIFNLSSAIQYLDNDPYAKTTLRKAYYIREQLRDIGKEERQQNALPWHVHARSIEQTPKGPRLGKEFFTIFSGTMEDCEAFAIAHKESLTPPEKSAVNWKSWLEDGGHGTWIYVNQAT